ncbi:long-chain fatty acid transport protein 6-like isoform X2 [Ostrea edulis]|uniref:long-chain fatty acid transport protein 6-like isoform X2 n=1 Tax=Ostrea edulis TaxID=37623 RepID=UPI0024AF486D|nr:long-chain fatty acid transport protein 6-like isoform X2 [Ostrea edulis]
MPLKRDKLLIGLGSVAGLSLAAWQTMCPWLKYDLQYLKIAMKVGKQIGKNIANQRYVIEMFEENVAKFPKQTMIIFEDKEYTFEFMNEQAKKVANIAYEWRFKVGEKVALLMQNHPAFIWTFLGLQKVGLSVAFLNHHNRGTSLLHTINVSRTRALIIGSVVELYNAIDEIRTELNIPLYICGYSSTSVPDGFISWDDLMLTSPAADICKSHRRDITLRTPCITIFTSGTTGLPKPVNFNHEKAITISGMLLATEGTSNDRLYTTTPLYHVLACIALFSVLESGATLVLKVQFSASQFFDDCRKHKVTVAQYVGELPRYLLHLPENRISPVKSFIVRYDPKTYSPLRNREGRCIPCNIGEPGLLIGGIPNKTVIDDGFYAGDKTASERKCVRNAFEEGDVFFNFGDLLYLDKDYFMYFKDRVGDTFRWKGENVSTNEVANVLTELPFIQDANVYGVEIPDADGRAGMAGILLKEGRKFKADMLSEIYQHCKKNLPNYAQPLFLRLIKEMPLTTTHKQKKGEYVKEGFNPSIIRDPLFRISPETKTYVPLTMDNIGTFLSKSRL